MASQTFLRHLTSGDDQSCPVCAPVVLEELKHKHTHIHTHTHRHKDKIALYCIDTYVGDKNFDQLESLILISIYRYLPSFLVFEKLMPKSKIFKFRTSADVFLKQQN